MTEHPGRRDGFGIGRRTTWFGVIAGAACLATVATTSSVSAQKKKPTPKEISEVTALVVMTPNGPASCQTWIDWRSPTADPVDTAAIEFWAEGYLSGLAAGSHHDVIGSFRHDALAGWLTQYCTTNPQTPLPEAIVALGLAMLAHPDGKL
jgi:hypothetical protein